VAGAQVWFERQTRLSQSVLSSHVLSAKQGAQSGPPQSRSDSSPLRIESVQRALTHTSLSQLRLVQSLPCLQAAPLSQPLQPPPPQSTPVSRPFLTRSLQLLGWQVAEHTSDAQSVAW
jgi:hypothetical protein